MNEHLNKQLAVLKYRVCNRNLLRQLSLAQGNLRLSPGALRELQWTKLRSLLSYAYENCGFYRRKYDRAGLKISDIRSESDFQYVPIITKDDIRNYGPEMVPPGIEKRRLEEFYTGGTTGVPIKVYRDRNSADLMNALYLRTIRFWGCDIGTRTLWFWGIPQEHLRFRDFRYQPGISRYFRNVTWFDAFDMTPDNLRQLSEFCRSFKPSLIIGYVSALYEYAQFLRESGITIPAPSAICITAEPSIPEQRMMIEGVFGTQTFNQYGSSEILHIAAECTERNGLHIHADSRYLEITDADGKRVPDGDTGNVVLTDLENRAMPIIRYLNGDIASMSTRKCSCRMNLPLMNDVTGRIYDLVTLKNGRKIYGHLFSRILFTYAREIRQFQFHQVALDRIVVRIVPSDGFNFGSIKQSLLTALRAYTGHFVEYDFQVVETIKKAKSGKLCYVISDVS